VVSRLLSIKVVSGAGHAFFFPLFFPHLETRFAQKLRVYISDMRYRQGSCARAVPLFRSAPLRSAVLLTLPSSLDAGTTCGMGDGGEMLRELIPTKDS